MNTETSYDVPLLLIQSDWVTRWLTSPSEDGYTLNDGEPIED